MKRLENSTLFGAKKWVASGSLLFTDFTLEASFEVLLGLVDFDNSTFSLYTEL